MISKNFIAGHRKLLIFSLILFALLGLLLVAAPVWIIQPFRPQTTEGLSWSFAMRRWSIFVTPVLLLLGLVLTVWLWRDTRRWWLKAIFVILLIPMVVAAWFSRQNHFEWMFNPLPNAAYAKASDVTYVADSDVVLAVRENGEAVAYPVRLMAYHHVVHDVVGKTPIVATY
jgi:thiol:disulfide interchange protein